MFIMFLKVWHYITEQVYPNPFLVILTYSFECLMNFIHMFIRIAFALRNAHECVPPIVQ